MGENYTRDIENNISLSDVATRKHNGKRKPGDAAGITDAASRKCVTKRGIISTLGIADIISKWHSRILKICESVDLPEFFDRRQGHFRNYSDDLTARDIILRSVLIILRILESLPVWDYPIWRKAKSTEELIIRSPVINEIEIDSEI